MIEENKAFAELLCQKDIDATRSFQEIYTDELYFVASKFSNIGIDQDAWDYRTKKGYTIKVNDEVSDTYVWLIHQVQIKSCLFKGLSEFKNYILSVLNSSFMYKDWLKWKTGVTGYVPKHIKEKGDKYIAIYKLMRQKKDDVTIEQKLEIDPIDLMDIKNEIYASLIKHNQLDLVENYKVFSLSIQKDGKEVTYEPADIGLSVEDQDTLSVSISQIDDMIESVFNQAERFIATAYWGNRFSADTLYRSLNKDAPNLLKQCNIRSNKDVYKFVTNFINNFYRAIQELKLPITSQGARTIIENYFLIKK